MLYFGSKQTTLKGASLWGEVVFSFYLLEIELFLEISFIYMGVF